MAEIDFGTLVTAVVNELNCTTSELFGDETTNPDLAVKRYARNVIGVIREVFDEAEEEARAPTTCPKCGAILRGTARYCIRCGRPQTGDAAAELLETVLAKEIGKTPDDPLFQAVIARAREEGPEVWDALVQKVAALVPAKVGDDAPGTPKQ